MRVDVAISKMLVIMLPWSIIHFLNCVEKYKVTGNYIPLPYTHPCVIEFFTTTKK